MVTDALGNVTVHEFNSNDATIRTTDARGHTTNFTYDGDGNLIQKTYPDRLTRPIGQSERFAYDANGNQVGHTDFNGDTTTFDYDSNCRLFV